MDTGELWWEPLSEATTEGAWPKETGGVLVEALEARSLGQETEVSWERGPEVVLVKLVVLLWEGGSVNVWEPEWDPSSGGREKLLARASAGGLDAGSLGQEPGVSWEQGPEEVSAMLVAPVSVMLAVLLWERGSVNVWELEWDSSSDCRG